MLWDFLFDLNFVVDFGCGLNYSCGIVFDLMFVGVNGVLFDMGIGFDVMVVVLGYFYVGLFEYV